MNISGMIGVAGRNRGGRCSSGRRHLPLPRPSFLNVVMMMVTTGREWTTVASIIVEESAGWTRSEVLERAQTGRVER